MKPMKRREMLAGLGAGTLLSLGLIDRETKAADDLHDEMDFWKYANIDPAKVADLAYQIYPDGSCMYATVRALLTTVADTLQAVNPMAASVMMQFPFHMMGYGHGGIGGIGSTCGAFNGGSAVIGLFVRDAVMRDAMIQELCTYYEQTELPKYKPKNDEFLQIETTTAESVLCHVSSGRWRMKADVKISSPKRKDRCRRLTADIAAKTAELLNRYHADNTCTFVPLTQPTATCFDCHSPGGMQADAIAKMDCATCHDHGETHSNKYINMKK